MLLTQSFSHRKKAIVKQSICTCGRTSNEFYYSGHSKQSVIRLAVFFTREMPAVFKLLAVLLILRTRNP